MSKQAYKFMIGVGPIGAVLLDICGSPCLRIDDKRWSLNTWRGNLILSQAIVNRLTKSGYVAVSPERLMDREHLVLTPKGQQEAISFALARSFELASENDPHTVTVDESRSPVTTQGRAHDLADKAFDLRRQERVKSGEDYAAVMCPGRLVVDVGGVQTEISDFLKRDSIGERAALLFDLIGQLAESSAYGLTVGEMPVFARWAGTVAAEKFERAPDQDWEFGGDDE
jgi:hypothetical protein